MLESALALGALLGASYVKSVERRSRHLLRHLQQSQRGMSGHLHRWDAELGYATVAGAVGFDYFPVGPEVPICIDEFGFRVPESGRSDRVEGGLLTLGCSFTFGQACRAEDTYAYQLGARLGLAVANAGVCGYGLQHTLLQARRWIPQIRPKVVVAQLAPWMQQRAEQPFAPSQFGRLTCPYFVGNPPQLRPPLFRSQVFEVPVWEFRQRSRGFFQKVGWPLFWHEDRAYLARRLQGMPAPCTDRGAIVEQVFSELDDLCRQHGSQLVVLALRLPGDRDSGPLILPRSRDYLVADPEALWFQGRPPSAQLYQELCGHWREGQLVDTHPNPKAHSHMAEALARALEQPQAHLRPAYRKQHHWILGISAYYHDSAACLLRDGQIVAAAQEERFTRRKADPDFPHQALDYCLRQAGIGMQHLDQVVYYEKPVLKFARLLETYSALAPRGFTSFSRSMPLWLKEKLYLKTTLLRELGGQARQLLFTEHHQSHAASAFFPSPFQEAAVLCIDGVGEWQTTTAWMGKDQQLTPLWELRFPHSLGLLYSAITYYTGFKVNSGEYKVMGLAPYGRPIYVQTMYDHLIDLKPDGTFRLNMDYFDYCGGLTMTNERFHALFGGPPREPETLLTQKEMDLARSVQEVTEEVMLRLARRLQAETGARNLCLAGGVALNCVANGRLLREGPFERLWIQPAAGDAGGALGAALSVWHEFLQNPRQANPQDSMQGAYLGPAFSAPEIEGFLQSVGAVYEKLDDEQLFPRLASDLADEKVIGWFSGRMEFGPRALGSRSILGDARSSRMQSLMNLKIKFRESFRPFAPCVLAERVNDYFEMQEDSPYMLLVAQVQSHRRKAPRGDESTLWGIDLLNVPRSDIPAVTHVDYSARVQTVHEHTNPRYYRLIREFDKLTGYGVLVNTSFNVRGEPIVCTPRDAYICFMRTDIEVLVLENYVLYKSAQPHQEKDLSWMQEFVLD